MHRSVRQGSREIQNKEGVELLRFYRFGGQFKYLMRFDNICIGDILINDALASGPAVINNADKNKCRYKQYAYHGCGTQVTKEVSHGNENNVNCHAGNGYHAVV